MHMKKLWKKIVQHDIGEHIPNLQLEWKPAPYGVLNERAVRATAGIMFLIGMVTFFIVQSTKNLLYLYPTVILFWIQFFIAIMRGPRYAPLSWLGKLLTSNQTPEYVWAIQKRFAWAIGWVMASLMLVLTLGFELRGWWFGICVICLAFMWLETAVGYCVGCKIYSALLSRGRIPTPKYKPVCAGGVCSIKK